MDDSQRTTRFLLEHVWAFPALCGVLCLGLAGVVFAANRPFFGVSDEEWFAPSDGVRTGTILIGGAAGIVGLVMLIFAAGLAAHSRRAGARNRSWPEDAAGLDQGGDP